MCPEQHGGLLANFEGDARRRGREAFNTCRRQVAAGVCERRLRRGGLKGLYQAGWVEEVAADVRIHVLWCGLKERKY